MFEALAADRDNHYLTIGRTIVRADQQAATGNTGHGSGLKRSQGGLTTKIRISSTCSASP